MKNIVEKLIRIEIEADKERGPFDLFALFRSENSFNDWDLVISSKWIEKDEVAAIQYIAKKIQRDFSKDELLQLSRVKTMDRNNPDLNPIFSTIKTEHGNLDAGNQSIFGLFFPNIIFITALKRN